MINLTTTQEKRAYQTDIERVMTGIENTYTKRFNKILNKEFINMARFVDQGILNETTLAVSKLNSDMVTLLSNMYMTTAKIFNKKVMKSIEEKAIRIPSTKSPTDEFWQSFNAWASTEAAQKVVGLQKTSKNILAKVIARGLEAGESNREISKRILDTGKISNPHRARVIARNETHTATVKSMDETVRSTRIEMMREWVSARDDRTRTRLRGNDFEHFLDYPNGPNEEKTTMDGKFTGTGEALSFPGDPAGSAANTIMCRCVIAYETIRNY